jgi:hypothetical protein
MFLAEEKLIIFTTVFYTTQFAKRKPFMSLGFMATEDNNISSGTTMAKLFNNPHVKMACGIVCSKLILFLCVKGVLVFILFYLHILWKNVYSVSTTFFACKILWMKRI